MHLTKEELLIEIRQQEIDARQAACQCRRLGGDTRSWELRSEELGNARRFLQSQRDIGSIEDYILEGIYRLLGLL